jgi:hypothetical protein
MSAPVSTLQAISRRVAAAGLFVQRLPDCRSCLAGELVR